MSKLTGFIEEGLRAAREAVQVTIDRAQLHLKPETISKRLASYVRGRIRMVETILRRLIILLAAEVELAEPAPAREASRARPARKPGALQALETAPGQKWTAAGPLLDRLKTLIRHLETPAPLARRMVRTLNARKSRGELRPVLFAQSGLHRLGWELGLVAKALPWHANDVLRDWFNTS